MAPTPRTTNSNLAEITGARRRSTLPYQASSGPVQDKFPAYEDFPWEKIEAFLRKKWPHWTNFKAAHIGDSWEFEIPEALTDGDREALRRLRDGNRNRRESSSPEP